MISLTSPVETRAHGWPAGLKLLALCAASTALFVLEPLWAHGAALAATLTLYALPGAAFLGAGLRHLRLLWPFLAIVLVFHSYMGEAVQGLTICARMITAVALANLVTMTTRLQDITDVLRRLIRPLERVGLRATGLETAIALVIRFTPVLVGKAEQLMLAWRARSRRRPGWAIILPLTLLALDDADQVSEALRARGGVLPLKD